MKFKMTFTVDVDEAKHPEEDFVYTVNGLLLYNETDNPVGWRSVGLGEWTKRTYEEDKIPVLAKEITGLGKNRAKKWAALKAKQSEWAGNLMTGDRVFEA